LTGGSSITVGGSGNITAGGNLIGDVRSNTFTVATTALTANTPFNFTQTWNNASATFTGMRFNATNTASGASSLLMDLQVGGVSQFKVDKVGNVTGNYFIGNGSALTGVTSTPTPAGSNTYVQFNDDNALGANSQFTYNKTTNLLTVGNIAGTLTTAAQPNITSLGTLSALTVSGNVTVGNISSTGLGNIANVVFTKYNETVVAGGNTGAATLTPNVAAGTIYQYTLTGNITLSSLTNAVAGSSMTLILKQDGTGGRTLTSTMIFAGGVKTLSTAASAIDVMSVFYDGTTYYASLGKGFA
jgi:hypothetical protein